jgi:serine protease inhibitor
VKGEDLFEVLSDLDDKEILEAKQASFRKKARMRAIWSMAAAFLVLCILGALILPRLPFGKGGKEENGQAREEGMEEEAAEEMPPEEGEEAAPAEAEPVSGDLAEAIPLDLILTQAAYPQPVAADLTPEQYMESDAYGEWWENQRKKTDVSSGYAAFMTAYDQEIMEKLLSSGEDNTVCSPLNTCIALAMLSEVTEGESRQQILDALHVSDMEELRKKTRALWEANYADTPNLKSLLANSLWLRAGDDYDMDTLGRLSDIYFASAFGGDPGSEEMTHALQAWTDQNTGGLLKEYTEGMKLSPDTVLALVSTIYYKAAWYDTFWEGATSPGTFHGVKGDTEAEMMHRSDVMGIYRTDAFTGISLGLMDSGAMHFYLPAQGKDAGSLVTNPDIWKVLSHDQEEGWSYPEVNLTLPKFKVSGKTDLIPVLSELGIRDVMDPSLSDFSPLKKDADGLALTAAEHAAMVEIDENGVTGAAYTELSVEETAALEPEEVIDLTFDRPFLFMVTGRDGSVLFSGVVRNIE